MFASLSNVPIAYMIVVDGWAHARFGADGMLYVEALFGIAAIGIFLAIVFALATRLRPVRAEAAG